MGSLYIRTEASAEIGFGHVMRCIAIAEHARLQGMAVTFLLNDLHPTIQSHLARIGAEPHGMTTRIGSTDDADAILNRLPASALLLVDSYAVTPAYLARLAERFRIVLMDDLAELSPMPCHMVINAAAAARDLPYALRAPDAIKLLGPDFAQIRREFTEQRQVPSAEAAIAVMFGGSDVRGYTLETVRRLSNALPLMRLKIVVGPAMRDIDTLKDLAGRQERLQLAVNPPGVAAILAGSWLVITAAGGSVGEIAAMGLMALVVIVADNQKLALQSSPYPVVDGRHAWPGELIALAREYTSNPEKAVPIIERALKLIDGKGCLRIVERMRDLV